MPNTLSRKLDPTGIILGIIGAALFSAKPILIKLIYNYDVEPAVLMALRMAFSLPFYLVFALFAYRQRKHNNIPTDYSFRTLFFTALLGFCSYYIASYLDLVGLTMITAQFERLILFTYPVFVIALGAIFLGQPFTRAAVVSLVLSYCGLAIIFTHDFAGFGNDVLVGASLVFFAAIAFACYIAFSKDLITRLGSRLFTCFAMIAASIIMMAHFVLLYDLSALDLPTNAYGLILLVAIFTTVIPTFFISEAIARIGATPASILGSAGPVFTTIMAIFILGEAFTLSHFFGMALIISGIAWLAFSKHS